MKLIWMCLAAVGLSACAPTITTPMGKMSEAAFVQIETVKAVTAQNASQVACFGAVGTIGGTAATTDPAIAAVNAMAKVSGINGCASGALMQQAQIPQFVPQKTGLEVVTDLGKTIIQYGVPGAVAIKQSGDARAISLGAQDAQTAQNGQQWNAVGGIIRDTTQAQSATSNGAFSAVTSVANASANATASASAANAAALGGGFAVLQAGFTVLPDLTPSITAGTSVTQGNQNDLSTRRDTLTAGTELRIDSPSAIDMSQYTLVCTAAPVTNTTGAPSTGQTCQLVPIR